MASISSRVFAYNPSQTPPKGSVQYGNIVVGTPRDYKELPLFWQMGPNEINNYIIARTTSSVRTYPIPGTDQKGSFTGSSIRFTSSPKVPETTSKDTEFLNKSNKVFSLSFDNTYSLNDWFTASGNWTSYKPDSFSSSNFVTTWYTTSDIQIPVSSSYTYNFSINWGDGTSENYQGNGHDISVFHRYSKAGDYTIIIEGTFPSIDFYNYFDSSKGTLLKSIINWGSRPWKKINFYGCSSLTTVWAKDSIKVDSTSDITRMFQGCTGLQSVDFNSWDVSQITDMSYMFAGTNDKETMNIGTLSISNWNTSNVTNFDYMFANNTFTSVPVGGWTTSSATSMNSMFYQCVNMISSNTANWNVSNVVDMSNMFAYCQSLTPGSLDFKEWVVSSVQNISGLFNSCIAITYIDVSLWNVGSVQNMSSMFAGCQELTTLDVSSWNTSNVTNMSSLFSGCSNLTSINVSSWNVSSVTDFSGIFSSSGLSSINITNWNTSSAIDISNMFAYTKPTSINVSNMNVSNVQFMNSTFVSSKLTSIDISSWTTSNVQSMSGLFSSCNDLTNIISNLNTTSVLDISSMFSNCPGLTSVNVSGWTLSNCTNIAYLFQNCTSLVEVDVSNWDVHNVQYMNSSFEGCSSLTGVDISNWDVSSASVMTSMFYGSDALNTTVYSNTLINWSALTLQSNVYFGAGLATYNSGASSSRQSIIDNYAWTITDAGLAV